MAQALPPERFPACGERPGRKEKERNYQEQHRKIVHKICGQAYGQRRQNPETLSLDDRCSVIKQLNSSDNSSDNRSDNGLPNGLRNHLRDECVHKSHGDNSDAGRVRREVILKKQFDPRPAEQHGERRAGDDQRQ